MSRESRESIAQKILEQLRRKYVGGTITLNKTFTSPEATRAIEGIEYVNPYIEIVTEAGRNSTSIFNEANELLFKERSDGQHLDIMSVCKSVEIWATLNINLRDIRKKKLSNI